MEYIICLVTAKKYILSHYLIWDYPYKDQLEN